MQAIRKIINVDEIKNIVSVPAVFGKKVEMILLPLESYDVSNEYHLITESMLDLQQESEFAKTILANEKEDVWNNV